MRRVTILLLALILLPATVSADLYLRTMIHTDATYHHGAVVPAEDSETELWIGDGKMSYDDESRRFLFDLDEGKLIIMEMADSGYVETDLPLDLTKIVPPDYVERLAMFPITGKVSILGETREVRGRECRSYMIYHFIDYNDIKYNETERTVWACDDLGIDERFEKAWLATMFTMNNFKPELIEQIVEAGGWELLSSSVRYSEGQQVHSGREVVEIEEREPPEGVYTVPSWFRKKDYINPRG